MDLISPVISFIKRPFLRGLILIAGIIFLIYSGFNMFFSYSTRGGNRENNVARIKENKATQVKEDDQKSREVIKAEVDRILEDANAWLQESIISNSREKGRLAIDFNKRGLLRSEDHIIAHINRVNGCIESIDEYIKKINGSINGLLLSAKEGKFGTVDWLKDGYEKYLSFMENAKTAKNNIKKQGSSLCIRFSDEATFENILKEHPYKDGAD